MAGPTLSSILSGEYRPDLGTDSDWTPTTADILAKQKAMYSGPGGMLRSLADRIPENTDLPAPKFFMDPRAMSAHNMARDGLNSMARWLQGTPGTADMITPMGGFALSAPATGLRMGRKLAGAERDQAIAGRLERDFDGEKSALAPHEDPNGPYYGTMAIHDAGHPISSNYDAMHTLANQRGTLRERSPEQAAKLGDYLARRQTNEAYKNHGPDDRPVFPRLMTPEDKIHYRGYEIDDEALAGGVDLWQRKKNVQEVDIAKLTPQQSLTDFDANYAKKQGFADDRPINVIKEGDSLYVIDGHHRLWMQKLLGKKNIAANVQEWSPSGPRDTLDKGLTPSEHGSSAAAALPVERYNIKHPDTKQPIEGWSVKTPGGGMVEGHLNRDAKTFTILGAEVPFDQRGQGHGLAMYQRLIDEAHSKGYAVQSDATVSGSAQRVYEALAKRGYDVQTNPSATTAGGKGIHSPGFDSPVFTVGRPRDTAAAAALPELSESSTRQQAKAPGAEPSITAYHGSPHDFDKFSMDKIGTGEGAQAYGHGLYFAEREGVARSYKDALAQHTVGGKPFDDLDPKHWAAAELAIAKDDKAAAIAELTKRIEKLSPAYDGGERARLLRARGMLQRGEELPKAEHSGKMYEVRIKADPEQFLDWDKPLSKQSEHVRKAIADRFGEEYANSSLMKGNQFATGDTKVLRDAGIPGIKYLDQGSRGAGGEGTRNFVVFDADKIEILKKYGWVPAGIVGGGMMMTPPDGDTGGPTMSDLLKSR